MTFSTLPVVWIVNHYSTIPSKDGAGDRHFRLAQELSARGWAPVLFLASTRHPSGSQFLTASVSRHVGTDEGIPYVMLKAPQYRGGIARLRNMLTFAMGLLRPRATRGVSAPAVIVGSTVHLLAAWSALRLARRYRVPFVFEIRDIWPESLIDLGKLRGRSALARAMRRFSLYLCRQAALVVSPLPGVREYLDEAGLRGTPFRWISNGVDIPDDDFIADRPENDEFVVMYLGSHGNANGLESVIEAFDRASNDITGSRILRLRLIGEGTQKEALRARVASLRSVNRIVFEDRIPRGEVVERAREADALIVNIDDLPVYRFGISLNKLYDYMASGRPTIISSSAMNNPIADADAGLCVPAGDPLSLAEAIRRMSELPAEKRKAMGARGAALVKRRYTYRSLGVALSEALTESLSLQPKPTRKPR